MTAFLDTCRTVDQVIADLAILTDEQRSVAWMPEPPREASGGHDCRPGGSCGLDLNADDARARWRRARFRLMRSEGRLPWQLKP